MLDKELLKYKEQMKKMREGPSKVCRLLFVFVYILCLYSFLLSTLDSDVSVGIAVLYNVFIMLLVIKNYIIDVIFCFINVIFINHVR